MNKPKKHLSIKSTYDAHPHLTPTQRERLYWIIRLGYLYHPDYQEEIKQLRGLK